MTDVNLGQHKTAAETYRSHFNQAHDAMKAKYDAADPSLKSGALSILLNWNFSAAQPTVNRENALYGAVALLYICMFFIVERMFREQAS